MRIRRQPTGFTLIEVTVAVVLLLLVATTAIASLRSGLATLSATESSSLAVDAVRELSEFTYTYTIGELDALDGTTMDPVLANGDAFPGAGDLQLEIDVQPVEDDDPTSTTSAGDSVTRVVSVTALSRGQQVLEASWLVAEN